MENTKRCWALVAACGFTFALGAAAVRADVDGGTIDLSASDKKVQVWHKSADGAEALIDVAQSSLDSHLGHGDRLAAPTTSPNLLSAPLGAPVMGEHDAAGAAGGTDSVTSTASTTATTGTTATPSTTGTTAPASSPAASLSIPGFGLDPLGAPVLQEHGAGGHGAPASASPATTSTTGTGSTTSTTSTTGTTGTTGAIPAIPAVPATPASPGAPGDGATPATPAEPATPATPAAPSSPAAALPGSDVSPLGAPLAGSTNAAALDPSKAFTGLVGAVPSTIQVKTFKLTDAGLTLDKAQLDALEQQILASPGADQNRSALEDQLRKENLITVDQKVIGVLPETKEIVIRRTESLVPAVK